MRDFVIKITTLMRLSIIKPEINKRSNKVTLVRLIMFDIYTPNFLYSGSVLL